MKKPPFKFDFSKCDCFESSTFINNRKTIHKAHSKDQTHLDEIWKFIKRGAVKNIWLRYSFNHKDFKVKILYFRWPLQKRAGKSAEARIWISLMEKKNTKPSVAILRVYKHSQSVSDIERNEAIKLVKKVFDEFDIYQ